MIRKRIDKILERILLAFVWVMLLSVLWQVFSRFILGSPSTVTDEISSFSLIWVGLLGAAYVTGQKLHLAIDLFPVNTVKKHNLLLDGFVHLMVAIFSFSVLVIGGSRLCYITFSLEQHSAALEIPLAYIYLVLPISGILIVYYSLDYFFANKKSLEQ